MPYQFHGGPYHPRSPLECAVHELWALVVSDSKKQTKKGTNHMADPLAQVANIKAGYEALKAKADALAVALAAAQAANPTSDFVTSDVSDALTALQGEIDTPTTASTPSPTPTPAPAPAPAPATPPASSGS